MCSTSSAASVALSALKWPDRKACYLRAKDALETGGRQLGGSSERDCIVKILGAVVKWRAHFSVLIRYTTFKRL
jgi:hypothetical protein